MTVITERARSRALTDLGRVHRDELHDLTALCYSELDDPDMDPKVRAATAHNRARQALARRHPIEFDALRKEWRDRLYAQKSELA